MLQNRQQPSSPYRSGRVYAYAASVCTLFVSQESMRGRQKRPQLNVYRTREAMSELSEISILSSTFFLFLLFFMLSGLPIISKKIFSAFLSILGNPGILSLPSASQFASFTDIHTDLLISTNVIIRSDTFVLAILSAYLWVELHDDFLGHAGKTWFTAGHHAV